MDEGVNSEFLLSEIANEVVSNRCSGLSPIPSVHIAAEQSVIVDREKSSQCALSFNKQCATGHT